METKQLLITYAPNERELILSTLESYRLKLKEEQRGLKHIPEALIS